MEEGDKLQKLSVLTQDERRLYHILRAVSSSLALVFSMFVFMVSLVEETCIFAIVLLGATIQDGGIGVRSIISYIHLISHCPLEQHVCAFINALGT